MYFISESVKSTGGGYNIRNYFPTVKNHLPVLKILFALALIFPLLFTSCSPLYEGEARLSISLPPVTNQSRSISGERVEALQKVTASYRVTVNKLTREGTGTSYTFTLPVGVKANVTVECLNSSGEVIARAEKSHLVTAGENSVRISLKNDGNEIVNTTEDSPPPLPFAAYIDGDPYEDFDDAWAQANSKANCVLKLGQNVDITSTLNVTGEFTLDLNGYTLSGNNSTGLIDVSANFTITDTSAGKAGKLTGGSQGNGGAVYVNNGTSGNYIKFTLESGKITGNNSSSGGNVYLNSYAEFIMKGGQITNNDSGAGAAVYMTNNTKFTMTGGDITGNNSSYGGAVYCDGTGAEISIEGGTISGNTAITSGGGIYILAGTLSVKGGQISGNTAGTSAGGIYVGSSTNISFNISGNVNIQGNKQTESNSSQTDSNVYLNGLAKINVTATLNNASRIGVRLADYASITPTTGRAITAGLSSNGTVDNFTDDYESVSGQGLGWNVVINNNEVELQKR